MVVAVVMVAKTSALIVAATAVAVMMVAVEEAVKVAAKDCLQQAFPSDHLRHESVWNIFSYL
jgi:hypothetical protein